MKRITLDFLVRWWWMVALVVVFAGLSATGQPQIFAPAAMICLIIDANRGLFRIIRPLPMTRREQALTWWIIGVPLLPLISLVPLCIGTEFYWWNHHTTAAFSPWFYSGVSLWVGLGYAALCFLLAMRLPTRPAVGTLEMIEHGIFGGLWGLSMSGMIFLLPHLPKAQSAVLPWHIWIFAAVPVCVVLSFLAAPDMMRRRMFVVAAKAQPRSAPESSASAASRLTGIPLYLVTFIGRMVLMIAFLFFFEFLFMKFLHGGKSTDHMMLLQLASFAMLFGAIWVEAIGLRSVRCLPLSRAQLTALLLSVPIAGGFITAPYTTWFGCGDPSVPMALNFVAQALALAGFSSLALAMLLHIASGIRVFVLMLVIGVAMFGLDFLFKYPLILAPVGIAAALLAFGLVSRGLRKSSAFYQTRRVFGTTVSQPMAVR